MLFRSVDGPPDGSNRACAGLVVMAARRRRHGNGSPARDRRGLVGYGDAIQLWRLAEATAEGVANCCWNDCIAHVLHRLRDRAERRSEEHTSELQSLMRISYAVFCLKKKITQTKTRTQ